MNSKAYDNFLHSIQDSDELIQHFDVLNRQPPPPEIEVLKRASLVMALAALETYIEDRVEEAVEFICGKNSTEDELKRFYKQSLKTDLKMFHSPNVSRITIIFKKYLDLDVTEAWCWNNFDSKKAKKELDLIVKKRGDIAHRSLRPNPSQPIAHAVTRDELRKHLHFIKELVKATDKHLDAHLIKSKV